MFVDFLGFFIAKNQSDTLSFVVVVLLPLSDFSSVVGDNLCCPVRALFGFVSILSLSQVGSTFSVFSRTVLDGFSGYDL